LAYQVSRTEHRVMTFGKMGTSMHDIQSVTEAESLRKHRQSYRHADPRRQQQHTAVAACMRH